MLNIVIGINGKILRAIDVRRIEPARPTAKTMCTYLVTEEGWPILPFIRHQYGKGAESLAALVLSKLKTPFSPPPPRPSR
jgi:hypothetical protein